MAGYSTRSVPDIKTFSKSERLVLRRACVLRLIFLLGAKTGRFN